MPELCRPFAWLAACSALLLSAASFVMAQEEGEESPYRPGLIATYAAEGAAATRVDEAIAFYWQDAAPDPRLPAGAFTAQWRGRLWTQTPGTYRLHCYLQGEVELKLGGKSLVQGTAGQPEWLVSAPIELPFDRHPLEIAYRKTGQRARLALFWSGPDFSLEPIPARFLMHDREVSRPAEFERGRQLAAALRCAACHRDESQPIAPAPALDKLAGNLHGAWLIEWLSQYGGQADAGPKPLRRMPDVGVTREEATAMAAWLLRGKPGNVKPKQIEQKETEKTKGRKAGKSKKADEEKPRPSAEEGERLIVTRGCLACHQFGELGESGLFGGGDLAALAAKRPGDFLVRWLSDPAAINRHHRMPRFTFTKDELKSLDLWARKRGPLAPRADIEASKSADLVEQGEMLVQAFRCAACHALTSDDAKPSAASQRALTAASDWQHACSGEPDRATRRPGYRLTAEDGAALQAYYSHARPGMERQSPQSRGRDLLVQLNCLACHEREGIDRASYHLPARLQEKLAAVAEAYDDLAPLVPSMTPPALNSVGDKLHDQALADAIRREGPPHRPYLLVEMPKFNLTDQQLADLTAYFTSTDRIPRGAGVSPAIVARAGETPAPRLAAAGPRLVTADGFGCTSCHQVGSVLPSKAPLNARGPNISMLDKRIRREWFDRWCANPARIVPRMEMPSVKVPVRGVLNDNVRDQLAAVWHTLNTPGFEPPEPNPVRVLRVSGIPERKESPIVIHDVVKDGDKTYLFPLVIGLPNRHNILFDLETNRLAAWWLGDTARQRTKGKSWHWEMGAKPIYEAQFHEPEISILRGGKEQLPVADGQYISNLKYISASGRLGVDGVATIHTLVLPDEKAQGAKNPSPHRTKLVQHFRPRDYGAREIKTGFQRILQWSGEGELSALRMRLTSAALARDCAWDAASRTLTLPRHNIAIRVVRPPGITWDEDGCLLLREDKSKYGSAVYGILNRTSEADEIPRWQASVVLDYSTQLPVDRFPNVTVPTSVPLGEIAIAPGIVGYRLPLTDDIMPSALAWDAKHQLVFTTLKGEVLRAVDGDGDGYEDAVQTITDGLSTPYGIATGKAFIPNNIARGNAFIDVAAKDGLWRLYFSDEGNVDSIHSAASGWGYTDDYHDWAVGLVPDGHGGYYVAFPCQQDERSEAAAKHRGQLLRLVPRKSPRGVMPEFHIEVVSSGHRFPMGLARNREGELFVTDNQGNYNPFNELNHVRPGAHFGFINALEKEKGYVPPGHDEPAIAIPHPWTRSVNGICFLETPEALRGATSNARVPLAERADHIYGPLEGHLVGCEYDTRRLIRMSLQKIGDTYQGAAYPLSMPTEDVEKGLLGPIVCAIKPTTGELYVGEIRDSGWGAGNNIGQIVKIKIEPEKLPCGIAEVRATSTGFTIDFFQPVDRAAAGDAGNYSLSSYRRESTPAYGGADIDRRDEKIAKVDVAADGKRVTLTLAEMRAGHVYEFHVKNLAQDGGTFFPDEAHYTLRQIPH